MKSKTELNCPIKNIQISLDNTVASLENSLMEHIISILKNRIEKRCQVKFVSEKWDIVINLAVDGNIGEQGFQIEYKGERSVYIIGDSLLGLLYGVGKFLHSSKYTNEGFIPSDWSGTSIPTSLLRGIEFDTHFCNWYHMAAAEELAEYIEDLALWGINYITVVFPLIDLLDWDDPEVDRIIFQIHSIYKAAKSIGIKVGLEVVPNQDFVNPRKEFKAVLNPDPLGRRGNNGNNICPNLEGAMEYILTDTYGHILKLLKEKDIVLDYLCFWPYDEGGCACEKCFPWGANGFIKSSRAISDLAKTYFPDLKVILSTWIFDTPYEGEWEGLARILENHNDWVDYIMADGHEDFPEYPLESGVPGNLPLLNYPEISMWGLLPWGGFGANPLIERFERLWKQVKHAVKGGIAYSEGIFDDINKVVVSQFYWNKNTTARETASEYISYEYSHIVVEDVQEILKLIEKNHTLAASGIAGGLANNKADIDSAMTAFKLAEKVDKVLPLWAKRAWRWRILFIRTLLDIERYERMKNKKELPQCITWGDVLKDSETAKKGMEELVAIYHTKTDCDDTIHPMHKCVRPPL